MSGGELAVGLQGAILECMARDRTEIYGSHWPEEHLIEKAVTYTLELDGKLFVIENVPCLLYTSDAADDSLRRDP